MATTYRAFVDGLEALSIAGVNRRCTEGPPGSLNHADLPAQFVELPSGVESPIRKGTGSAWPTLRAKLVIVYEAAGQNLRPENFDGVIDLLDKAITALRGFDPGKVAPTWEIEATAVVTVAGTEYWAVVASVEVEG